MNPIITLPDFYLPSIGRKRTIHICLPPDYHTCVRHYPVMYMHDGQNLFDEAKAYAKAWHADRIMSRHSNRTRHGWILVGIENGGIERLNEYAPFERKGMGGGLAHPFLHDIQVFIKPFIDSNYRTLPHREHTAMCGSSMGGLLALYAGAAFAETFGNIAALSPSLWFNPQVAELLTSYEKHPTRWYVVGSRTESRYMAATLHRIYEALKSGRRPDSRLYVAVRDRGRHNESFWGREFRRLLMHWHEAARH